MMGREIWRAAFEVKQKMPTSVLIKPSITLQVMKGRQKFRGVPHHLPHIMGAMVCMAATHGMGPTVSFLQLTLLWNSIFSTLKNSWGWIIEYFLLPQIALAFFCGQLILEKIHIMAAWSLILFIFFIHFCICHFPVFWLFCSYDQIMKESKNKNKQMCQAVHEENTTVNHTPSCVYI